MSQLHVPDPCPRPQWDTQTPSVSVPGQLLVPSVPSVPRAGAASHDGHAGAQDSSLLGRASLFHEVRTSAVSLTGCCGVRGPHTLATSKRSHLFVEEPG